MCISRVLFGKWFMAGRLNYFYECPVDSVPSSIGHPLVTDAIEFRVGT
jgi:hypothetical protein